MILGSKALTKPRDLSRPLQPLRRAPCRGKGPPAAETRAPLAPSLHHQSLGPRSARASPHPQAAGAVPPGRGAPLLGAPRAPRRGLRAAFPTPGILAKGPTKVARVSGRAACGSAVAAERPARSRSPRPAWASAVAARVGTEAGAGRGRRGGGELTVRGAAGCRRSRGRGRVSAVWRAVDAAEGEQDPGGSPQCPRATPSPLEVPGTGPKFGGNWGQGPVVLPHAGYALAPRSMSPRLGLGNTREKTPPSPSRPGGFKEDAERPRGQCAPRAGNNAHVSGSRSRPCVICGTASEYPE